MAAADSFSHLDATGKARMVDVSAKKVTRRVAEASCRVLLSPETIEHLSALPKGDAVSIARIAGIQAAKRTAELIPLAHPLPIDQVEIEISPQQGRAAPSESLQRKSPKLGRSSVTIRSRVVTTARTGAEMEALTACAAASLALYDMVKAVERDAVITDLRLESKSGGKSGDFRRGESST